MRGRSWCEASHEQRLKTLVLGGYGNFGARIARALADDEAIELVIGGRDGDRAERFAAEVGRGARGVAIDRTDRDLAQHLHELGVELLIHCAGPFQGQGYEVARAAAGAGANYLDLADGRRFVCDFASALDETFRSAGRVALSGASTLPALSSAVVEHLCDGWRSIDAIDVCIAPAQTAPLGAATLAAVLDCCGAAIEVWDEGRWQTQRGWSRPEPVEFARLPPRLGALCDVPDLEIFPRRLEVARRVTFRAALEIGIGQRALAALAALRAAGLVEQPARLARPLNGVARAFDAFGSALGGMVVRVAGRDAAGRSARRAWHVAADHGHGPEVPCMAAILLARRFAAGDVPQPGARVCMGVLRLAHFLPELERWRMMTDLIEEAA